jgi:hypothetical protein
MKANRVSIVLSIVMLIILVSAVPGAAKTERIEYTGTVCITSLEGGSDWVSGDMVSHTRNVVTSGTTTTTTPYLTGNIVIMQNSDINLLTGEVHAYGSLVISPTAYPGATFVGHWSTHVFGGVLRGSSTAIGTGDLEGVFDFNDMQNPANPNPNCFMGGTDFSGSIMITP